MFYKLKVPRYGLCCYQEFTVVIFKLIGVTKERGAYNGQKLLNYK